MRIVILGAMVETKEGVEPTVRWRESPVAHAEMPPARANEDTKI